MIISNKQHKLIMSDVLREYHFDSLKTFATILKRSDWSEVSKEFTDSYLRQLNHNYQQVLLDSQNLDCNSNLLVEAEKNYVTCKKIIDTHIATMNPRNTQYFGEENRFDSDMPPQREEVGYFSGSFIDWCEFLERFNRNVHSNNQFTNAEKLRQLLDAVTGHAARVLGRWDINDANYLPAINKLRAVYGNKYMIASAHIDALEAQPTVDSTFDSITSLIDEVEKVQRVFSKMGMSPGLWEQTIVRVVGKRLDERSKESWITIRHGDATGTPTLEDMLMFLRGRTLALPSTSHTTQIPWNRFDSQYNQNSSYTGPKTEPKPPRNSGKMSMKNSDCYICQSPVRDDQIECLDCPVLAHFRCLKNAGVVKNKKVSRNWKCQKCLRCAHCRSTSKMVSSFFGQCFYRFQCAAASSILFCCVLIASISFRFIFIGSTQEMQWMLQGLSWQMPSGSSDER